MFKFLDVKFCIFHLLIIDSFEDALRLCLLICFYYCCLVRVIIIKSMKSQSIKDIGSSPQVSQYFKVISTYNLVEPLQQVDKTILIYYIYQHKHQSTSQQGKKQKALLNNLYTFSQFLLNTSLKIKVVRNADRPTTYKLQSEDTLIKHQRFNVQEVIDYDVHSFTAEKKRVVILPVNKELVDLIQKKEAAELQSLKSKFYEQFFKKKERSIKNQELFKSQFQKQNQTRVQKTKTMFNVFVKMEELREHLLQKTKQISIIGILGNNQNIEQEAKQQFAFLQKIVSNNIKPRLLVFHNRFTYEEDDDNSYKEEVKQKQNKFNNFLKKQNCCGIFSYDSQGKFTSKLLSVWEKKYFNQKSKVKFMLFYNLRNSDSQAFRVCVIQFINNWKKTAQSAVQPIAQIYRIVSQSFEDVDNPQTQSNFKKIHQQYKIGEVLIPKAQDLKNYFTKQNVLGIVQKKKEIIQVEKEEQSLKIPPVLNNMVFIHCFHRLQQSILSKDALLKSDTEKRLQNWKDGIKNTFCLIASLFENIKRKHSQMISSKFGSSVNLMTSSKIEIKGDEARNSLVGVQIYQDMQKYFNFVSFVFSQIQKIHRILGEATMFADNFKILYKQLTMRENKIINFITQNKRLIRTNEEILYYDILAYMIKTYKGNTRNDDLQYIECHVLQLKASEIACNYIYDDLRIVQAVQAYSTVVGRIHELPQIKNSNLFNLYQIEQKIAKLLNILGLSQKAANIYMYLKMFRKAYKLFKQYSWRLKGDQRAQELIKWAQDFQKQFEFNIAQELYGEAFQNAITNTLKVKALQSKRKCIARQRRPETEEELRAIQKYLTQQDLFQFTNQSKLRELFIQMQNLKWDVQLEEATL